MLKHAHVPVLCCLLLAAVCPAEKQRITLTDGDSFVAEIVEKTPEGIKVQRKLAVVFYKNEQVKSIEPVRDPKTEYAQRLAKLDKTKADAHVKLGRWCLDRKLYKQAVERFEAALAIDKDNMRASLLLRQAKAKLANVNGNGGSSGGDNGGSGYEKVPFDRKDLLKMDDIHRIRLEEVRQDDRISVEFRDDVIEKFIRQMQGVGDFKEPGSDVAFRRLSKAKQAKYILDHVRRDDSLKEKIIITTDPAFMKEFRGNIWRIISGSCASVQCHGAPKGQGKLKLYNYPGRNVQIEYTNFLILDSFHREGLQMIRRSDWEKSLLLQYGLPAAQAQYHHPKKRPAPFSDRQSVGYRRTLEWIKKLKGPLHPDYRIKHRPPFVMAPPKGLPGLNIGPVTTKPATKTKSPF